MHIVGCVQDTEAHSLWWKEGCKCMVSRSCVKEALSNTLSTQLRIGVLSEKEAFSIKYKTHLKLT